MAEQSAEFNIAKENFRISEDFLAKYNTPGPRYTSYPTAPAWNDNFGVKDLENAYSDADAAGTALVALYASSLLRKSLSFLRVQCGYHQRPFRRAAIFDDVAK